MTKRPQAHPRTPLQKDVLRSFVRLARDPNRSRRRFGGWPHPRSLYPYTANRKNLFFGAGRSILRKGAVPLAELFLGKQRILEIYLNVVEWGPGIYGANAACHDYDGTAARNIDRQQAATLAAILPASLKRRPARMNQSSALILERMRQMGW